MRKIYCDICGADITNENMGSIYHLLLDKDNAPFDNVIDIPDVCEECAKQIHDLVIDLMKGGNAT